MRLVDTSVWVDHLRKGVPALSAALEDGRVATHPFVIGELACGNLANRTEVLSLLEELPKAPAATDAEVLELIERRKLMGRGIGYIDAHLLAAVLLGVDLHLWTRDRRLNAVAQDLGVATTAPR
jgi:hypothetical protein